MKARKAHTQGDAAGGGPLFAIMPCAGGAGKGGRGEAGRGEERRGRVVRGGAKKGRDVMSADKTNLIRGGCKAGRVSFRMGLFGFVVWTFPGQTNDEKPPSSQGAAAAAFFCHPRCSPGEGEDVGRRWRGWGAGGGAAG